MITFEQAKECLLKEVDTPNGRMILYGLNLLPDSSAIGLIFYQPDGKQIIFFSEDCRELINI